MSDDDEVLSVEAPIRGLVNTCLNGHRSESPDRETEMVVADWCEEHGLVGIAVAVRDGSSDMRWAALSHLWQSIDPVFWTTPSPTYNPPTASPRIAPAPPRKRKKR